MSKLATQAPSEASEASSIRSILRTLIKAFAQAVVAVIGIFLLLLLFQALGPTPGGIRHPHNANWVQQGHTIGLAMYSYFNDHDQKYPEGKSSTEIFQQLLDGGYLVDPAVLYLPLPEKIKALPGQKLKPENVCWDVTSGVDSDDSPGLPLLFMTGYQMSYAPGGGAVPVIKPFPQYGFTGGWSWLRYLPPEIEERATIVVFYHDNSCMVAVADNGSNEIARLVRPTFDAHGKTYRQLTP